jgi:hypothetical protein
MSAVARIAMLAGVIAVLSGCDRRSEEVVVAPAPPIQPEPVYEKF